VPALGGEASLEVYPNPFPGKATVRFVLAQGGAYAIGLYDGQGKLVKLLSQGQAPAGELQAIEVDAGNLARGVYLVRLQTSTGTSSARLLFDR
jgi:hypothetical protein